MLRDINEVNDHLFIGGFRSVTAESLQQKGITSVINCSLIDPYYSTHNLKYTALVVEDNEKANIAQHFDLVCNLIIEEHQNGGKTLVYCVAGISRSATLCLAYLMKSTNMNLRIAFRYLRSRRPIVRPNNNFFRQLIDYEMRLFGKTSVDMVKVQNAILADKKAKEAAEKSAAVPEDSNSDGIVVPDVFYEVCKGIVWLKSVKKSLLEPHKKK